MLGIDLFLLALKESCETILNSNSKHLRMFYFFQPFVTRICDGARYKSPPAFNTDLPQNTWFRSYKHDFCILNSLGRNAKIVLRAHAILHAQYRSLGLLRALGCHDNSPTFGCNFCHACQRFDCPLRYLEHIAEYRS